MAEQKSRSGRAGWKPTAEADSRATRLRLIAGGLWLVAIGLEVYGIFGLLLDEGILESSASVSDDGTVTVGESFPTWAFWVLIGLLVVMAVLTIVGSQLWKKAQELDPPSERNPVSFFLKSQLGAIVPLIAFVPIIVLIFLNKNMSKQQKGWAAGVGIVLAIIAVALGINYDPPSQEEYTADQQAVIQLLGEDRVFWTPSGTVYHVCESVSDLARSEEVESGTTSEAVEDGIPRLTLEIESELNACGRAVPNNIDQIVEAIRAFRDGNAAEQILPAPDWSGVEGAPSGSELDDLQDAVDEAKDEA
jgi:predicted small integral membrane protein